MSKEIELLKECRLMLDNPINGTAGRNLQIRITELLYTAPPKREPIFNYTAPDYITGEYLEAYDLGFRDAEKAHGITGVDND